MADYSQQKVPELKKILADRGLVVSGNKADLIARLVEDDKKSAGGAAGAGEDEIDWDEDDDKPTTAPAAAAVAAGGVGPVDTPVAVPNQKVDVDPSTTSDLKVAKPESPKPAEEPVAKEVPATEPVTEAAPAVPEAPKENFSIGLEKSDAEKEAEKRAARAKRFGIPENEEAKKIAERAKKFGTGNNPVVESLDTALPERRPKRVREEKQQGGRQTKRQTPDRRTEKPKTEAKPQPKKQQSERITDDPVEKAKAEARAARFAKAS